MNVSIPKLKCTDNNSMKVRITKNKVGMKL